MNAVRLVARRQVRTLMLAAGVRSSAPAFSAAPLMQLRTAKKAAAKTPVKQAAATKNVVSEEKAGFRAASPEYDEVPFIVTSGAVESLREAATKWKESTTRKKQSSKDALKKAQEKQKAAIKEKRESKRIASSLIKASGAVHPYMLFVQKTTAGKTKALEMDVGRAWKALSEGEKQKYRDEAKKNLAKRSATRQSFKRKPSKYAAFTKVHFAAAYEAAKATNSNHKAAFKAAVAAVAKKYKSQ